jgi:hypothetical protein
MPSHNYSTSPFKWRLGLLNYDVEAPRHVRSLVLNPLTRSGGLSMTFARDSNDDIFITAQLVLSMAGSAPSSRQLCMCNFTEVAGDVLRRCVVHGEDQLFMIAEAFHRSSGRGGLGPWTGDKKCCATSTRGNEKTASYRVPGTGQRVVMLRINGLSQSELESSS